MKGAWRTPGFLAVALTRRVPAAAHQQTRILFNRFIPSSSASRSPFAAQNPLVPPPQLAPKDELTPEKVDEHIDGAFEIAKFLRTNVVQGVRTDEGNYGASEHLICGVIDLRDREEPADPI